MSHGYHTLSVLRLNIVLGTTRINPLSFVLNLNTDSKFFDENFNGELPDIQLLLEQKAAKSKGRITPPPSLFDPITPPKPNTKPKSRSAEIGPETQIKISKHKETIFTENVGSDNTPRVGKSIGWRINEKTVVVTGEAEVEETSGLSDHDYILWESREIVRPVPQGRRRLIQGKFLVNGDSGNDDHKEQTHKILFDLTCSDSDEVIQRPTARVEKATIENKEFESPSILDEVCGAVLTYSPPRSSRPHKILPPASSAKKPLTKRKPPSQHQSSSGEFWDQGTTNSSVDSHMPSAIHSLSNISVDIPEVSDNMDGEAVSDRSKSSTLSRKVTPMEPRGIIGSKTAFNARKKQLAEEFLKTVDDKISNGEVASKTASAGGVKIVWSKTLRTTAGTAKWKIGKPPNAIGQVMLGDPVLSSGVLHYAIITLSEKVVDSEEKLYNVLCHEYCHLANYIISNVRTPPHGVSFKKWASLCTNAFSDLNVYVTTTHSYDIETKYKWACQACGYVYKRHSKSIDITRCTCGVCRGGKLTQTHPPPRGERPITEYQAFVKANFGRIKAENPGAPQREVMKIVAGAYKATKGSGDSKAMDLVEAEEKEGILEEMFDGLKV